MLGYGRIGAESTPFRTQRTQREAKVRTRKKTIYRKVFRIGQIPNWPAFE